MEFSDTTSLKTRKSIAITNLESFEENATSLRFSPRSLEACLNHSNYFLFLFNNINFVGRREGI